MSATTAAKRTANIAVIGAGWWSQGWHLPQLFRNDKVNLTAIVDSSPHPTSNLNPNLESLATLSKKYKVSIFSSVSELLKDPTLGPTLDGALIATPHATHSEIGEELLREGTRRKQELPSDYRPLNLLMEKPMTTNVHEAKAMHDVSVTLLCVLLHLSLISFSPMISMLHYRSMFKPIKQVVVRVVFLSTIQPIIVLKLEWLVT